MYLLSQILVIIAYLISGYGFAQTDKLKLMKYLSIYNLLMFIQYVVLGGIVGAISSLISILRNFVVSNDIRRHRKSSRCVFFIFFFAIITLTSYFYKSPWDLLPCAFSLLSLYVYWCSNTTIIRICNIIISFCYFAYSIPIRSYITMICEVYLLISILCSLYKEFSKKKKLKLSTQHSLLSFNKNKKLKDF